MYQQSSDPGPLGSMEETRQDPVGTDKQTLAMLSLIKNHDEKEFKKQVLIMNELTGCYCSAVLDLVLSSLPYCCQGHYHQWQQATPPQCTGPACGPTR